MRNHEERLIYKIARHKSTPEIADLVNYSESAVRSALRRTGLPDRDCPGCGVTFAPTNTKHFHCTPKCYYDNHYADRRRRQG